jgi:hypothetical protein
MSIVYKYSGIQSVKLIECDGIYYFLPPGILESIEQDDKPKACVGAPTRQVDHKLLVKARGRESIMDALNDVGWKEGATPGVLTKEGAPDVQIEQFSKHTPRTFIDKLVADGAIEPC